MIIKALKMQNWKNFLEVDIELKDRVFIVGPNASGKSNLLDAFRFLHDLVKPGGGFQKAIEDRGGIEKLRCLHARRVTDVLIKIVIVDEEIIWEYSLIFNLKTTYPKKPIIKKEFVKKNNKEILVRPDLDDRNDQERLTQTFIEQINANRKFREIADYFQTFQYLHIVPQLIRFHSAFKGTGINEDPFGQNFLERIVKTQKKTQQSRLNKIEKALHLIVPNFVRLKLIQDELGNPHLEVVCSHWRAKEAGKQREDQFSDGTLRVIGLLWALLDNKSLLLLEEPELSLHDGVVSKLASIISRLQKDNTQVFLSTHSISLLSDQGISADEIIMLIPEQVGTNVKMAKTEDSIVQLLRSGFTPGEAVLPRTTPPLITQLELFND